MDELTLQKALEKDIFSFYKEFQNANEKTKSALRPALEKRLADLTDGLSTIYTITDIVLYDRAMDLCEKILLLSSSHSEFGFAEKCFKDLIQERDHNSLSERDSDISPYGGTLGERVHTLKQKIDNLPTIYTAEALRLAIITGVIALFIGISVHLFPAIRDFFNGAWVENGFLLVGAVATIVMFFVGGFLGSGITLFVCAFICFVLDRYIGMGLALRLLITAITVIIGIPLIHSSMQDLKARKNYSDKERQYRNALMEELDALQVYAKVYSINCMLYGSFNASCISSHYNEITKHIDSLKSTLQSKDLSSR